MGEADTKQERGKCNMFDELSARSALLQFYGQRAVSFASLFIASIFGLITWLAIARGIEVKGACYLIFMVLSSIVYIVFAYASRHTFRRFVYYANIASKLATESKGSVKDYANFEGMDFEIGEKVYNGLTEELKKEVKKEDGKFRLNFQAYFDDENKKQYQSFVRDLSERRFGIIHSVLMILLWIVVYVPLLISYFS
jgi:hypothetical protein